MLNRSISGLELQNSLVALGMVAILLVLIAGFVSYRQALHLVESGAKVAASHELISALEIAESEISDIEAFQRGFVIVNVDMLFPYKESLSKINSQIQKIDLLTRSNQEYAKPVAQLVGDMANQMEFAEKIIMARSSHRINDALEEIEAGRGNRYTNKIRKTIQELKENEKKVLVRKTEGLHEQSSGMTLTVMLLGVLALGFLLLLLIASNLYVRERRRIENLTSAQHEISQCLAESGDLSRTIERIVQITCERLEWDAGSFWQAEERGDRLLNVVFWHNARLSFDQFDRGRAVSANQSLAGRAWREGQSVWIPDLALDQSVDRKELVPAGDLHGAFAVPVLVGGVIYGVMEFFSSFPRGTDERVLETFNSIGNQLGQFIQRKQSEWQLQVNQARLNAILGNMAEAVVVADKGGTIIQHNPAATEILGEDLLSKPVHQWDPESIQMLGSGNYSLYQLPLVRAINQESVDEQELIISNELHPRGLWVSATARPVKDAQGDQLGGVMVLRDISERKEAERRVSEFYSMVSHELRTPLTSIRASLGLMQGGIAGELPGTALELIDIGREECDRLIRLINNILDIRKIEAGKFELNRNEVEPETLVKAAIEAMRAFAEENSIKLLNGGNVATSIVCDADRLIQVLTNLVSNAIKFSPPRASIIVKSELITENIIKFSVSDHGPGIPPEHMKKLFQKFQQLDQSDTRKMGGSGLGLAICKAIVEEHGGTIGVHSVPGKGSHFYFNIPCEPEDDDSI